MQLKRRFSCDETEAKETFVESNALHSRNLIISMS